MSIISLVLILLVALLHIYFLILETFLWQTPYGLKTFNISAEFSAASKALASNQGLYNGFMAAGLFWGLSQGQTGENDVLFFLICIVIAGVFGAVTVNKKILWIQALPSILAIGSIVTKI